MESLASDLGWNWIIFKIPSNLSLILWLCVMGFSHYPSMGSMNPLLL